jgi:hypothetical protein
MKRWLRFDWDAIAGILAAVVALIMHFLHIADAELLLTITLVLLALLLLRDLRRESQEERALGLAERTEHAVMRLQSALHPPGALLIGPHQIRIESEQFTRRARGEMIWFNVCLLMFRPQLLFDSLLRPAIENPSVTSIQFIADEREKDHWQHDVLPKVVACRGGEKVQPPYWCTLPESVSFILSDTAPEGMTEALLSFWGEPFMARTTERDVPRYIFYVPGHSELVARLSELARSYRLSRST